MVSYELLDEVCEGRHVEKATIKEGNFSATVLSLGAVLSEVVVPDRQGKPQCVVLHMDKTLDNVTSPHYGQIIGRFANRIASGVFSLDGKKYEMEKNDHGNTLHGASSDFGIHQWRMLPFTDSHSVTLLYQSADGDGGMPGNLVVTVTYSLDEEGNLSLKYAARSDKDTPLNLTNHTYFNLSGKGSIEKCRLQLRCPYRLEVNDKLIPTGTVLPVVGTPFDFTEEKAIGKDINAVGIGYDHCYIIDRTKDGLAQFGSVYDPESGIEMKMKTTLPAVQFYSGNFLDGSPKCNGAGKHEGMCFETQFYPDSPNHPSFPSCILKAGVSFSSETVYSFTAR